MKQQKRFYGGSSKAEAPDRLTPYNPRNDKGYKESAAILARLKPGLDAATHKMTAQEIIASLPGLQAALIESQKTAPTASPGANWGYLPQGPGIQQPQFTPQQAPQYQGGLFNGPQQVNPASLQTPAQNFTYLAGLLGAPSQGGK